MMTLSTIPARRYVISQPANLIVLGYIVLMIVSLQSYLRFSSALVLGMLGLPFVLQCYSGRGRSYRYLPVVLIAGTLCFLMPVKTLLYFTICFTMILLRESVYGKTGILVPAIVLFASPAFYYLVNIFSFPLRLQLTKAAGTVFQWMDGATQTEGNVIIRNGHTFSVDPACMGLSMITTSSLFGILLIAFYQRKSGRGIQTWSIALYLSAILFLNVIANLLRIIMLVLFRIPAETLSHDMAGIVCLLAYVLLPAAWLAYYMARKCPVGKVKAATKTSRLSLPGKMVFHMVLLGCMALLSWRVLRGDTLNHITLPDREHLQGYELTVPSPGIIKLESRNTLAYIKYIRGFYDTDHNPMICWTGSGYRFEKVMEDRIGNHPVFTATLVNGPDRLYTAWWYDNGINRTIDQFIWRTDLLQGAPGYALVNITCPDKTALLEEAGKVLEEQRLAAFFKQ